MKYLKNLSLFILFLLLGLSGAYFYLSYRSTINTTGIVEVRTLSEDQIAKSPFSIELPPSESYVGTIATMSGTIEMVPRTSTESAKLLESLPIYQGTSIVTKEDGNITIAFSDAKTSIILDDNSDISFIQTLPANIVIEQHQGTVTYDKDSTIPLSIRIFHLLLESSSQATILVSIDPDTYLTTITMLNGFSNIAYNSKSYVTQTQKLSPDETWVYDDGERRIIQE